MKYLDENKSDSKIDKITELFNELVLEFNNICKNGFDEISSNSDLKSMCNQINLLKNNIFSLLNKISQKNEMESILKKLTRNLSKKEKDFVSDAFQDFDVYKDNNKPVNNLFNDLSNLYNMLISKKNHFLSIINDPNKANSQNALLLDIDSEIKILENNINQYKESNKHLYLNLSINEKQNLQIQKNQIDDLNSRIISYFSKIKNDNLEIKDDLNLYIEKLNAINNLYLSLKTKFNEIINNKDFFLNLKLKKNLSLDEKYDVIESKVNQIKWEYNYKLFEIKSNFEISKQREGSFSNPKIIQIKAKIKDIENVIYSLLNEKSDYLKNQLKYILATENKEKQNVDVSTTQVAPVINNENEKLLEKKVELLESQLMKQLEKINTENTNLLLNVENKINNLSNSLTSENIQSKISHFSDEFKEIISNISRELMDIKDKVNDVDSKPNLDINVLSNKIDSTLKDMDDKNLFNKSYLEDFIRLFNSNLEKYLGETINKIEVSYKENSKSFRTEVINDSRKYKDDILNQVVDILKVNLKESNLLVDRLSNKIIDFKNDHRNFVRENNKIIFSILKKNESEKSSIQDLLRKISDKNDEMSDEAQMNKLFFHNSKLLQLDDLIKQQNDSFLNLLNDKEKIYYEVEKILLNKNKSEKGEAKLKRIESEINDIKIIINSKIESVEKSFKEKFDFINKDYIDEIQISNKIFTTDFEMAIFNHINTIEGKLINNFSDIKQNILSVVSQVYSEIESIKDSSLTLPELDEKLALLATKIDEIKVIEQEESVTKFNLEEVKKLLADTNISIEEKLSKINLLQNDLSKNISNELQSILSENSQSFLIDMKKTLNKSTDDTLTTLEDKLSKIDISQSNLTKNLSGELHSILNENSQHFLSDMKKTLIDNTSSSLSSLDDKLSKIDSNQTDLSTNIAGQLHSILNENSQNFLTNMKKTLNDNTNETILTIDEKLSKLSAEETNLPKKISSEVFSVLDKNNEKFLTELNKSLETNKNETINISNKIYSEINKFRNDHKLFISENNKIIFSVLKKNENEKKFTRDLLKKISDRNDEMQDEAQMHKLFTHNSKLLQLDDLIKQQNDSFLNLLNDKESIYFEIEKILLNKTKDEKSDEKLKRIEFEINNVKDIINSKIDKVETSFIQKFDFINKDYIDELQNSSKIAANDFEMAIFEHINTIEGKLINNFSDIKQNILSVVSQVYTEIESIKDSSFALPELDEKLALLASKIEEIKIFEQEENVTKLNFEEIKQLLANTNISIDDKLTKLNSLQNDLSKNMSSELKVLLNESSNHFLSDMKKTLNENSNETLSTLESKLSKLDLSQSELSKNITTELHSILSENFQNFFVDIKNVLTEKTNESLSILEEKLTKLNLSQNDLPKYISNELHSIIDENSKLLLVDVKKTLIDNTSETLLSLDDKLSKIDSNQLDLSTNISNQLFSILNENSQNFLTNMKKTLNDNTNETILTIDEKLSKISSEENELPQKISAEVFSILNQNNDKFLTELNKSLETNKNETINISNKIYSEINKFRNDHKLFISENNKIIFTVLKKNENEKRITHDLLKKISDRNDEMQDESQMHKLFTHNSKLLQLDDLIKQQNDSFLNLLNDKESIYFEIEKILLNKTKDEKSEEKLKRIESEISNIKDIINSKIDRVETSFIQKFDFINKDYIDELQNSSKIAANDFEIAIFEHINTIEGKLINNFSDIKQNILSVVSQAYSEIGLIKDSSLTLPELDQKLALLASKIDEIKTLEQESVTKLNFEEIKQLLANTNISIDDKLSQLNSLQNDLSKNISGEILSIINENSQTFLSDIKNKFNENTNDAFLSLDDKLSQLNLSHSDLSKNISNELKAIINENSHYFLSDMKKTLNENSNETFSTLESKLSKLDLSQSELSKNITTELHSILSENSQHFLIDMKTALSENTSEALLVLEEKFSKLDLSQNDLSKYISAELLSVLNENSKVFLTDMKKTLIDNTSETLLSLDDKLSKIDSSQAELSTNISSQLFLILNENSQNFLTNMKKTLNDNTNETLLAMDEKLSKLSEGENNLPEKISTEVFSILNQNNEKFLTELNKSLEINKNETINISNRIYNEINKFRNDHKHFIRENNKIIFTILKKNENEKRITHDLLKKISDRNDEMQDEAQMHKLFTHNSKLLQLDDLIKQQNDSFLNLLNDKENIYFEIERILLNKNKNEQGEEKLKRIELEINDIKNIINSKIDRVETSFKEKFDFISKDYIDEMQISNKLFSTDFEIAIFEHINTIEGKLINNFSDIKHNILSVVYQVYSEIESIKDSSLTLPELDQKLVVLASKIDEIKTFEQEESITKSNFDEIKQLLANTNISMDDKLSQLNSLQNDLSKNMSSELQSIINENSQTFLTDVKKTLNENANDAFLSLEDKIAEINSSQYNLSNSISSKLESILDQNSQTFLTDMQNTLITNTNDALVSIEEKLTNVNLSQIDLPKNISSELHLVLDENSKQFLTSVKDTLNENTNETLLTLEEKISRLNIEENNLPQRISEELFSVMDKKNEKLFSDLNKSLEDNKNETMDISNKIYNEINKFKNDQLVFIEKNRNWFKTILENNQKNKHYIKKLLAQINSKNEELSLELESSKMTFHNNKLFELEELIARQTSDVSSLLQEKNMIYDEIERILTSKKSKEKNGDKLHRIENEISTINSNFEDKFKSLQNNLINKFDSLNKQYINEIETEKFDEDNFTKEIFNNINSIENTLLENFNSVQLNIATSIKSIYEQVELLKNKSLTESEIENRLLYLVKEIKNLKELEDLISTGDVSFNVDELNANYKKIAQDLYKQISSSYLNNSQDVLSKIDQEFFKINNEFNKSKIDSKDFVDKVYEEINKYRTDQKDFILKNKNWFQSIINNNNIDKRQISQLLMDINENKNKMTDESQLNNLNIFLNKLIQLEEIIIEQNNSLIALVEDKERIYEEIQNILIAKEDDEKEESYQQRLKTIYKDIENISHNFISKINDLKDLFAKKFSTVQLEENEGSFNLNDVELEGKILIVFSKISIIKNKLFDNFDLVGNNIFQTITDVKTQIKQIIKTSLLEKEMRNKFFHLAQQIEDIKVFELSNILNKQNVKNIDPNVVPSTDKKNFSKSNNNKNVVSDRLEELLELYNIKKIDKIMKASNFYYEYEKEKNELSELFADKLSEVCLVNDNSISRIKLLNQNSDSILESNKIILEINSLIDQQNNKINSLYLYRNSILEDIENKVLFVKYNSNLNDVSTKAYDEINIGELIQSKIDNFNNDFLNKFNSINTNDLKDADSLNEISEVSEDIVDNWNNIKEILIDSLKLMETNIVSIRDDLISLTTSNNVFSNNVKKMSNNLNYDLKLIDDISMKDIIVLENKRKEIDDFYRKLRYLGKKY